MYVYCIFFKELVRRNKQTGVVEFYRDGKWVRDKQKGLDFSDAWNNYGDYTIEDIGFITEEQANKIIDNK